MSDLLLHVTLAYPVVHLFFRRYGPLRALHSFPTRRSSDLGAARAVSPALRAALSLPATATFACGAIRSATSRWYCRSEEHTSELQSHHDLVCRLLLEKKNTRANGVAARRNY